MSDYKSSRGKSLSQTPRDEVNDAPKSINDELIKLTELFTEKEFEKAIGVFKTLVVIIFLD